MNPECQKHLAPINSRCYVQTVIGLGYCQSVSTSTICKPSLLLEELSMEVLISTRYWMPGIMKSKILWRWMVAFLCNLLQQYPKLDIQGQARSNLLHSPSLQCYVIGCKRVITRIVQYYLMQSLVTNFLRYDSQVMIKSSFKSLVPSSNALTSKLKVQASADTSAGLFSNQASTIYTIILKFFLA